MLGAIRNLTWAKFFTAKLIMQMSLAAQRIPIPYKWGGKVRPLSSESLPGAGVDCSGFTQWGTWHASNGGILIPEGSAEQNDWWRVRDTPRVKYADAARDKSDALYICYFSPRHGHAGHTWFLTHAHTLESHGGSGVDARSPYTPVLSESVEVCYRLF